MILVDGPAGVGKTQLIERLVVDRARAYFSGNNPQAPILHVQSRGKRLAGLVDVMASAIQFLRGQFTFDEVPVLVRHGILQLAIDGFDELVDSEGYDDAWYALRDIFTQIGSGGPIILAGRDTFFDQQKFVSRIKSMMGQLNFKYARLAPVRSSTAREWLSRNGWSDEELKKPETAALLQEGSYVLRPIFLKELGKLGGLDAIEKSTRAQEDL